MYAKRKALFYIFLLSLYIINISNCKSQPSIIPDNGTGTVAVRTDLDELASGQTELAITGTEIKNTSEQINNGIGDLERSITGTAVTGSSFEEIIRAIRKRPIE